MTGPKSCAHRRKWMGAEAVGSARRWVTRKMLRSTPSSKVNQVSSAQERRGIHARRPCIRPS